MAVITKNAGSPAARQNCTYIQTPVHTPTPPFKSADDCTHPYAHIQHPKALEARCAELHREIASQGALLAGDLGRLAREANALRVEVASASNLAKKVRVCFLGA